MSKNHGYIAIHRKIIDWEWYDDIPTKVLFIHILLNVNHSSKQWRGIVVPRGSVLTGLESLSSETGLSRQQVRSSLNKLISTGELTRKTTNKYSIISITNWESYQINNTQDSKQSTNNQQTINKQITATNNVNNNNNVNNDIIASVSPKLEKTKKLKGMRFQNWLDDKDPDKITEEWLEWGLNNTGWDSDRIILEMKAFQDYWNSKAGQNAIKMDWSATWRNWIRNAMKYEERGIK